MLSIKRYIINYDGVLQSRPDGNIVLFYAHEQHVRDAILEERERCAKIVETWLTQRDTMPYHVVDGIVVSTISGTLADAIRKGE